jgi:hypothetical protein
LRILILFACFFVASLFTAEPVLASKEKPTPAEFQALLKLDYQSFDQNLPEGGWRGIKDQVSAGQIIDIYHLQSAETLLDWQRRTLYWHAGQVYAGADLENVAIARFEKSFNPDEPPEDDFKWNAYVRGTIAFMKRDRSELVRARDDMATSKNPNVNLSVLEGLLRCFDKPYNEAYGPECRPPRSKLTHELGKL